MKCLKCNHDMKRSRLKVVIDHEFGATWSVRCGKCRKTHYVYIHA